MPSGSREDSGAVVPALQPEAADAAHNPDTETPDVKCKPCPPVPSDKERDEHNASGHAIYRSWCASCVGGRGRSERHVTVDAESRDLPTVGSDFTYLAEKKQDVIDEKASPILVSICNKSGWIRSDVVPTKSGQNKHVVMMLVNLYIFLGFARFIAKTDQEPAILDLKRRAISFAKSEHGIEILPEESPTYESPSNGFVEGACGRVKALVRILKHSAEVLHNVQIPKDHPMLTWAVSYAAAALSRFAKGPDGFTAWYRLKQKPYRKALPWWSEKLLYLPAGKRTSRIRDKWLPGVFLGVIDRSDELMIGTTEGVIKARSWKRLTLPERSDSAFFLKCIGTPWEPVPSQPGLADVPITTHISAPLTLPREELPPPAPAEPTPKTARRTYIRKDEELKNFGYTPGCLGCKAAQLGTTPVGHSPECRKRIEDLLEQTEAGQKRINKAFEKALAAEEELAKKRLLAPTRATSTRKWLKKDEGIYARSSDGEPGGVPIEGQGISPEWIGTAPSMTPDNGTSSASSSETSNP